MSREDDPHVEPAEILDDLAAQVADMTRRGRHALDLIRGVPASPESRRQGTELRGLIAELGEAKRHLNKLRQGLRAADLPAARSAVVGQLQARAFTVRALLSTADDAINRVASHVATSAPPLERPRTYHDRPTYGR